MVAKICLLTAQAANLIFDHLLEANKKIKALKSLMGNYIFKLDKQVKSKACARKSTFDPLMDHLDLGLQDREDAEESFTLQRQDRMLLQGSDAPLNMAGGITEE